MMNKRFCQVRFYIKKTDDQINSIKIVTKRKKLQKKNLRQNSSQPQKS